MYIPPGAGKVFCCFKLQKQISTSPRPLPSSVGLIILKYFISLLLSVHKCIWKHYTQVPDCYISYEYSWFDSNSVELNAIMNTVQQCKRDQNWIQNFLIKYEFVFLVGKQETLCNESYNLSIQNIGIIL